jgi:methylglutaconyl-CoA hydratase
MTYQTLDVRVDANGVARVALNAPDKRNALSALMIAEITDVAQTLGQRGAARVMVLSGHGKVFCAGGDLGWMQAQIVADRATRMAEARKLAMMLQALNTMPVPLIGRIHGGAFGGGVGLACVCDVAIAGASAKFGLTETRLGLIPATISPYVIARMGEGRARQVFMSAKVFGADEAVRLGIVAQAVPDENLDDAVEAELRHYLAVAPGAVGRAKALARSLGPRIDADVIDATIQQLADAWETDEAAEGIAAFLEKRAADWSW